ncbi:transcriptional regulator PdhR [compost metagenome]
MYAQRDETREQLMRQHRDLYEAIVGGRAEEAREISQRHIDYVREVLSDAQAEALRLERSQRRQGA